MLSSTVSRAPSSERSGAIRRLIGWTALVGSTESTQADRSTALVGSSSWKEKISYGVNTRGSIRGAAADDGQSRSNLISFGSRTGGNQSFLQEDRLSYERIDQRSSWSIPADQFLVPEARSIGYHFPTTVDTTVDIIEFSKWIGAVSSNLQTTIELLQLSEFKLSERIGALSIASNLQLSIHSTLIEFIPRRSH